MHICSRGGVPGPLLWVRSESQQRAVLQSRARSKQHPGRCCWYRPSPRVILAHHGTVAGNLHPGWNGHQAWAALLERHHRPSCRPKQRRVSTLHHHVHLTASRSRPRPLPRHLSHRATLRRSAACPSTQNHACCLATTAQCAFDCVRNRISEKDHCWRRLGLEAVQIRERARSPTSGSKSTIPKDAPAQVGSHVQNCNHTRDAATATINVHAIGGGGAIFQLVALMMR